jgi:hypothetical protein
MPTQTKQAKEGGRLLARIVLFRPAYDKRDNDPQKNYGIHGVELVFVLKGPAGAIQFVVLTDWQLPHVTKELEARGYVSTPMPADVGYHSPIPRYKGQSLIEDSCEWLDGKPCYYVGSGLQAYEVFEILRREGSDGVWRELERRYRELFSGGKGAGKLKIPATGPVRGKGGRR